jgi:hypothetical protein
VIVLTLVIGVLNVCLGYALAVYLGYGPPGLPETWQALSTGSPLGEETDTAGESTDAAGEVPEDI